MRLTLKVRSVGRPLREAVAAVADGRTAASLMVGRIPLLGLVIPTKSRPQKHSANA